MLGEDDGVPTSLAADQVTDFDRDGFLVLPGFADRRACEALVERAAELRAAYVPRDRESVFTTRDQERVSDEYFLSSGPEVRFFFEPDGVTLNKIGHALHDRDPLFDAFSRDPRLPGIAADLGLADPVLQQSMYLVKDAHKGGEVDPHQDATFLWTDPVTVTGFWWALQDATVDNGCLWAWPGGHRQVPLARRFVRAGAGLADDGGTAFAELAPEVADRPDAYVPLEAEAGTLVVLHGLLPHRSGANTSPRSRHAYSVHVVERASTYPPENWLQRSASDPARGF